MVVRDTGVGIAAESMTRIFEPFQQADTTTTRRFGGTGLGLSIVKQLVERMGGSVSVSSELGQGTTFEVSMRAPPLVVGSPVPAVDAAWSLATATAPRQSISCADEPPRPTFCEPCSRTDAARCVSLAAPATVGTRRLHVLVAEDDDTNALLAKAFLEKLGHAMQRARNGAEAVAKAASETFDVTLMDVQMPELDGLEATTQIRARDAVIGGHVPIVALTANAMKGDDQLCFAHGMDLYLSKPVNLASLDAALSSLGVP